MNVTKFFVKNRIIQNISQQFRKSHKICPPTDSRFNITLMDSTTQMGEALALMLKQNPLVRELRLYDDRQTIGISEDLNGIDTFTKTQSFCGENELSGAIKGADIVVNCGGYPYNPYSDIIEVFEQNADDIRRTAVYLTEFNREAIFCIARPIVEAFVPLAYQEYKKSCVPNADKKIIGMANYTMMRANRAIAKFANQSPFQVTCPIIGGVSTETAVVLLSGSNMSNNIKNPRTIEAIQDTTCYGYESDLILKCEEKSQPFAYAPAVAAYRLIDNILRGLRGDCHVYDCCFLRHENHLKKFSRYFTTIAQFGKHGIHRTYMPYISGGEMYRLKKNYKILQAYIHLGESYVNGLLPQPDKRHFNAPPCETVITITGEVRQDAEKTCKGKAEQRQGCSGD